ncbi:ErfK/YbiS/YcfS/YnhG family protein [Oceanicola sp. 22II-s10i]|uniref:L,D-transpeptidase n=1 Tax=Oceanicola sp. 22II-s10i TaxID=1317116 RepID=UPI000B52638F|nr:L,D-transpeptidase [Oceanicola sp. 22II-s10i]OWU85647.1 ErfK/YbiS/YcfS/YnhG family protein [Oceanicola sp. 22II-s10i]
MHRRHLLAGGAALAATGFLGGAGRATAATGVMIPPPQLVTLPYAMTPYEVHVFPDQFRLYWTLPDAQAWEYPIRVGRDYLYEDGEFYVGAKKEWPSWTPTPDMIEREPEKYGKYADGGMPGGPNNPLGARALYLFQEGRGDTFLRIHGTNEPETIGRAVSNGCAGLINEQITLLYDQVPIDTRVKLYPKLQPGG